MSRLNDPHALDLLVSDVQGSAKYRDMSLDLIRTIAAQELTKRRTHKEAVKATKNKLHQVSAAYLDPRENYTAWLQELREAQQTGTAEANKQTCKQIMSHHASTRERLPLLEQFYSTLLAELPAPHSVLDLACGLNALTLPWFPHMEAITYYACDIYRPMIDFLNATMEIMHIRGCAEVRDILQSCPTQEADLALVLKTIPCLEQIDKQAGTRLLRAINARYMIVSFPAQSLGGRNKGMVTNYEARFYQLVEGENWEIQKYEFATELVFVIKK
nr:ribosomal RNA methyltransferase (FmrO) [uncultured bacterium]